ncbi:MAG TPA: ribonuclease H-like domain-containing protein, partial [Caldilineaceae bacterium]|nr:ribonuclease H-like domain-containing protein [Caldilineaceae bacterium]
QNRHIYGDLRGSAGLLAPERAHLDLLHPARRLWRRRLQSCRLIHLEEAILGVRRSEEDVPGHLIPQLYLEFVQSGDARQLQRIFYHNLEDILSMVGLATQLSCAFAADAAPVLEREDWLAFAQCLEERQQWGEAEAAYQRAIEAIRDPAGKREAFQRLGQLLKRQGRWSEAAATWESWLTTVPGVDPTPYVELAKLCEWQQGDLDGAAMWTQWAIHTLRTAASWQRPPSALADLEHRLARLERKRSASAGD